MKTKHRSRKTRNHITKELGHKNLSFRTMETWFCYILPKICLGITKKQYWKDLEDHMHVQFPATRGLFYVPLASLAPADWEYRHALGNLTHFFTSVMVGLSPPHPSDLILQLLLHPFSSQWSWLDFDLKMLFVPTVTSDVNLLHPSTVVIPNELKPWRSSLLIAPLQQMP